MRPAAPVPYRPLERRGILGTRAAKIQEQMRVQEIRSLTKRMSPSTRGGDPAAALGEASAGGRTLMCTDSNRRARSGAARAAASRP